LNCFKKRTPMNAFENKQSNIEKMAEDLFEFAIDREALKWLMARLPREADINRATVEYELQILKIIGTGWAISYFLEQSSRKQLLLKHFWNAVFEFSKNLSETTGLMTGRQIDYFQILKDRLDAYVNAMAAKPDTTEPALAIGPEFARICGNADDMFTYMTGSKMFMTTIVRVRDYIESTGWQ